MGKIEHKNGQVGSGIALNMIKANSNAPFELGGQKGVGKNHMEGPLLQGSSRLKNKINKLSAKHAGLYSSVIEGEGQNKFTSGDYDKDYKKLGKVEDSLKRTEEKYLEKFGESPYGHSISDEMKNATREWVKNSVNSISPTGPRMEGPLNKQKRFDKTVSKAEDAYDKGNYKKAFRKGKSGVRQAKRHGVISGEEAKNLKQDMKSSLGLSMKGPLNAGCAKSAGGPGCVEKRGNEYVIINNKKPGNQIWRSGFPSRKAANDNLAGYHASK